MIITERRSAHVTPAVCKASAGAVEWLSIAKVNNLSEFLEDAKKAAPGATAPIAATKRPTT